MSSSHRAPPGSTGALPESTETLILLRSKTGAHRPAPWRHRGRPGDKTWAIRGTCNTVTVRTRSISVGTVPRLITVQYRLVFTGKNRGSENGALLTRNKSILGCLYAVVLDLKQSVLWIKALMLLSCLCGASLVTNWRREIYPTPLVRYTNFILTASSSSPCLSFYYKHYTALSLFLILILLNLIFNIIIYSILIIYSKWPLLVRSI